MKPNIVLDEVTITADRHEKESESVKMSTVALQPAQIKNDTGKFNRYTALEPSLQ